MDSRRPHARIGIARRIWYFFRRNFLIVPICRNFVHVPIESVFMILLGIFAVHHELHMPIDVPVIARGVPHDQQIEAFCLSFLF
ncbi:MAG TPA: hypothetical protein VN278_04030 [Methanosarcina sp.]|nr:hypothetical protein [Methanosarcina sp.]